MKFVFHVVGISALLERAGVHYFALWDFVCLVFVRVHYIYRFCHSDPECPSDMVRLPCVYRLWDYKTQLCLLTCYWLVWSGPVMFFSGVITVQISFVVNYKYRYVCAQQLHHFFYIYTGIFSTESLP